MSNQLNHCDQTVKRQSRPNYEGHAHVGSASPDCSEAGSHDQR